MSTPWWRSGELPADPDADPVTDFPPLLPDASSDIQSAIRGRRPGYTPDWTPAPSGDAGEALVGVFGEQAAPVFVQANRLRDKYRRELLRIAGVTGREPGIGRATVLFSLLPTATDSVPVPAGTQLTVPGAGGAQVIFETERDLFATAAVLAGLIGQIGDSSIVYADRTAPVPVFGRRPQPGNGLWLGFDGPLPYPRLTLQIVLAGTDRGGNGEPPVPRWELLTADGLIPADVHADDTDGMRRGGIVELGTRRDWAVLPVPAPGARDRTPLRWLRIGLRQGSYDTAPTLMAVRLNAVAAAGFETVPAEVLTPVPESAGAAAPRSFQALRTPVLRGTMQIEIDVPNPADPAAGTWTEVPSLAVSRPYDRVFEVDGARGVVTFGDGVHGAVVPPGFRQVRATSYRTGGGAATNVAADAGEPDALVARGPALLAARDRAITTADVEVLAPDADAGIGRVIALPGVDSDGATRPGRLTLVVVGTGTSPGPQPVPSDAVLDAVTAFFDAPRTPRIALGARIVVEPARFVQVQLEVAVQVDPDVDRAATLLAVADAADAYLDPRTGGEDGHGWPPGGPIRYRRLLARIAAVAGITSVRRIGVQVAGRGNAPCTDAAIPPYTLPWPLPHLVLAVEEGGTS